MTSPQNVQRISISLPPALVSELRARDTNFSGALRRALTRYFETLRRSAGALREALSEGEVSLILDALNGVGMMDEHSPAFIPHEIKDAIDIDRLDRKWGVDGASLVAKLSAMSYAQLCALADAAERYWERVGRGEQLPASSALE